jgi:hypothetical protein
MSVTGRRGERRTGRVLQSAALAFIVAAMIVGNLPDSALRSVAGTLTEPFLNATGLYQGWGVFANPRTISAYVNARVDYSDGTSSTVAIPDDGHLAAFSDYRWQKYMEMIRPDDGSSYWPAYAEYVANKERALGHDPVRITLVRRWAETLPPGPGPEHGPWHQNVMSVTAVGSS